MASFETIKTTASGNLDNKHSWSGLHKHMEHDPNLNHSNEYLNTEESQAKSKYNYHEILVDYDAWTERNFSAFVKRHDKKMLDKNRKFGSVKRFLKVNDYGKIRERHPDQEFLEKLSNKEDYKQFEDSFIEKIRTYKWKKGPNKGKNVTKKEAKDLAMRAMCKGFKKYARGFNQRNSHLTMFEYYIHLDEEGAPHLHSRIMPLYVDCPTDKDTEKQRKKKKNKKPSWSLNTALSAQYHNLDKRGKAYSNQANLRRFREQEDNALIDCMNEELEHDFGIKNAFKLIRKTAEDETLQTGESHDVYKAKHKALDKLNAEIASKQAESKKLDDDNEVKRTENEKLNDKHEELKNKVADASTNLDSINNAVVGANTQLTTIKKQIDNANKAKEQAEQDRDDVINTTTQEALKNAEKAKMSFIQSLNAREQAVSKREHDVAEREHNVYKREVGVVNTENSYYKVEKRFLSGFYGTNIVTPQQIKTARDGLKQVKKEKHFIRKYWKRFIKGAIAMFSNDEDMNDISDMLENSQEFGKPIQSTQPTQPKIRQMYPKESDTDLDL